MIILIIAATYITYNVIHNITIRKECSQCTTLINEWQATYFFISKNFYSFTDGCFITKSYWVFNHYISN